MDELDSVPTFKVVLCGDSGVGKTAWVERLLSSRFVTQHKPTIGVDVHTIVVHTNIEPTIRFQIIEMSGQRPLPNGYDVWDNSCLKNWQAGIIMFDVTTRLSYKMVPNWYRDMIRNDTSNNEGNVNVPIVLCGNKVDVKERKVKAKTITFHRKHNLQYYDISVKAKYHYEKPLLWLARALMKDQSLEYIVSEIRIPGIDADPEAMEMLKEHLIEMSLRPKDDFDLDDLSASEIEDTEIERPTEDSKDCDEQGPVDNIPGTEALDLQKEDFERSRPRENLFVLCTHCIRMIFIEMLSSDTSSSTSVYSLATTTCRTCRKQNEQGETSSPLGNRISPELIRSTRLYECCARIAGDEATVELLLDKNEGSKTVSFMSTEEVADKLNARDHIYSVNTENSVLHRLEKQTVGDLLLPYVLGGFF